MHHLSMCTKEWCPTAIVPSPTKNAGVKSQFHSKQSSKCTSSENFQATMAVSNATLSCYDTRLAKKEYEQF